MVGVLGAKVISQNAQTKPIVLLPNPVGVLPALPPPLQISSPVMLASKTPTANTGSIKPEETIQYPSGVLDKPFIILF